MCEETHRRYTEDIESLGKPPSKWQIFARARYNGLVEYYRSAHASDLADMLWEKDPKKRAILAHLIGWKVPKQQDYEHAQL